MRQSEKIGALAKALVKFQGEVESAKKDSTNPHFKSKYADITAILEACRGPLASNGLSVVQMPMMVEGIAVLTTRVMHESGEWLEGEWPLNPVRNDPQGLGAASTYARRYSLQAALGIATEDDDGETASGRGAPQQSNGQPQQRQPTRSPAQSNAAPVDQAERTECERLLKLINGEIGKCKTVAYVDQVLADNASGIDRIGRTSEAGKKTIFANADKMKDYLTAQQKEAA